MKIIFNFVRICFPFSVILTYSLMTSAQDISASAMKRTFSHTTAVSTVIKADITEIWALLTTAEIYPNWNYKLSQLTETWKLVKR